MCYFNRLGAVAPATPAPNEPSTSQSTPQKTAVPTQDEVLEEKGDDELSSADTPVKAEAATKPKQRKKGQPPTRSSPRKQVAKRTTGAPAKSTLEKLEENLAAGETIDVDLSADSDTLDQNAVNENISDDEVSSLFFLLTK